MDRHAVELCSWGDFAVIWPLVKDFLIYLTKHLDSLVAGTLFYIATNTYKQNSFLNQHQKLT